MTPRLLARLKAWIGKERRFTFLLVFLLFYFFLGPIFAKDEHGPSIGDVIFTVVLIMAAYSASEKRRVLYMAVFILVPTAVVSWLAHFHKSYSLFVGNHLLLILFFVYIGVAILGNVFRNERVTLDKINAALCSYLLLGMVWSFIFSLLELVVPGSFHLPPGSHVAGADDVYLASGFRNALYFSFVTLTTLGYGDITPASRLAQNLCAMEAVMGQVYMTVLVARLVGLEISHASVRRPGGGGPAPG